MVLGVYISQKNQHHGPYTVEIVRSYLYAGFIAFVAYLAVVKIDASCVDAVPFSMWRKTFFAIVSFRATKEFCFSVKLISCIWAFAFFFLISSTRQTVSNYQIFCVKWINCPLRLTIKSDKVFLY